MGSSGSGRITDYPGSSKGKTSKGGGGGGSGPVDRCAQAFSTNLEDVEQSDYYRKHGRAPATGAEVSVAKRKRLVAQTAAGESVGNLPTQLNYLAACLNDGWRYVGTVRAVTRTPAATTVSADFTATK